MRGHFPFQWTCTRLLLCVSLLHIFLCIPLGIEIAHANAGKMVIDITPTFFPHPNARPRAYFIYQSYPTALIQDSITVKNVGTARGTVSLFPVDAYTSPSSGATFTDPHSPQHDIGAWIKLSTQHIALNPGQSQDIPFHLNIPAHVRPGQHGGGILAEVPRHLQTQTANSNSRQATLQFQSENILGVLVNLPGATLEKLNATGISYDTASTYQKVLVTLKNAGTQLLHPYGNLQVLNTTGQIIRDEPLQLDTFLPQTAINYPVYIHHNALSPGTYTAKVHLNYEHNHTMNYVASFVIPMPPIQKNTRIPRVISDLVTLQPDLFHALTPGQYLVGIVILLAVLWSMFSGGRQLYLLLAKWKLKSQETDGDVK
jgi:hypothetical protein